MGKTSAIIFIFIFFVVIGYPKVNSEDVEQEGIWVLDEVTSTEYHAVYSNGSLKKLVISENWDKYRLSNGSLVDTDYSIVDFEVSKSRFNVKFGEKFPSINFTFKGDSLSFSFRGYGIYDRDDGDYLLLKNPNDITPVVDGNIITYENIINGVDISYEVNKTGANKLITFVNKTYDSLPDGFSDNTFIVFVERIEGDYPKTNSSFGKMLFKDVMIPDADDVWKKVITKNDNDYLLTAIRFDRYNSSEFPFSIDPTFSPTGTYCGVWDEWDEVVIESSINVGCSNCSITNIPDCSWTVNASSSIVLKDGYDVNGAGDGWAGGGATAGTAVGFGYGGRGIIDGISQSCGGGGGQGGAGGDGGRVGGSGEGVGGSTYNDTYTDEVLPGSGGGTGSKDTLDAGGNGGAGIYFQAPFIELNGTINMGGGTGSSPSVNYWSAGGGGSGGTIVLRADELRLNGSLTLDARGGNGGSNAGDLGSCGGGGGGGGRIRIFYNNLFTWGGYSYNVSTGQTGRGEGASQSGNFGDDGSYYTEFYDITPGPFYIGTSPVSPQVTDLVYVQANLTDNLEAMDNCTFVIYNPLGDGLVNNTNGTMPYFDNFNVWNSTVFEVTSTGVHTFGITCTNNYSTMGYGNGTFDVGDTTIPMLDVDYPVEGETITQSSSTNFTVFFDIAVHDAGGIKDLKYYRNGIDVDNQSVKGAFECGSSGTNPNSCSVNGSLNFADNLSAGETENYEVWWYVWDNNDNLNWTNVNFTIIVPETPVTPAPPGGGGGGAPTMAVIQPHCGNGVCEPDLGESIFSCREDCATLAIFTTGEIFEQAVVVNYFIIALIILGLALNVPKEEFTGAGLAFKKGFRRLRRRI